MVEERAERRKAKRIPVNFIVTYQVFEPLKVRMFIGDREIYALMADLSEAGMAILTGEDIPPASVLLINFTLIDTTVASDQRIKRMEIISEVRYNILREKNEHRLGIEFTQILEYDKTIISEFVKKILSRPSGA